VADIDPLMKQARPGWALILLAAPIALFVLVVVLYSGMWSLGLRGREAGGGPVDLPIATCPEAVPVLRARLEDAGLPAVIEEVGAGHYVVHTARTGRPDVDAAFPEALTQPGRFALTAHGRELFTNDGVTEATFRLDGMMDMWLLLRLNEAATEAVVDVVKRAERGDRLVFVLDGEEVAMQPALRSVQRGEVEGIPLADMDQKTRMRRIAEWSMQIDHPLPCEARVEPR